MGKKGALAIQNGDGPTIEEVDDNDTSLIKIEAKGKQSKKDPSREKPELKTADSDLSFSDLAMPEITGDSAVPEAVKQAGFTLAEKPACDTEYSIEGGEMQVLNVSLRKYQEMCFGKHSDITHRNQNIKLSDTPYGMRLKNMTGSDGIPVQFTPGFVSKIVPLSLSDHPELICKTEAFLAATDAGLRIDDERRPGFLPYKALRGTGVVFLKSVGTALFHQLKEGESCLANTPNVIAFQTFCNITDKTVEHPDPPNCFGQKKAAVFPHMKIDGPGLVMLAPLYPDAHIIPISLEEYPNLMLKPDVFMAASDPALDINPQKLRRNKEAAPKGELFFSLMGHGMVFLNVTGSIVKYQVLKPQETWLLNTTSIVAFQGSCVVTQEKATEKDSKFRDLKVTGPGLVIVQSLTSEGRRVERWGFAKLTQQGVVPKPKDGGQKDIGHTPSRPLADPGIGKSGTSYSKHLMVVDKE